MILPQPSAGGAQRLRRGALAATAVAFALVSLSACGAGGHAETTEIKPDNAATSVGGLKLQNVNVITQPDGAEGPAVVSAKIFNNGRKAQTLEAVSIPSSHAVAQLSPAKGTGPLTVPAGGSLLLGGKGNASAVLADGRKAGTDGDAQRVVFSFSTTGDVKITAFVMPSTGYFTGFGPSALPTPTATVKPTGSATPSGSASSSAAAGGGGALTEGGDTASGKPRGNAGH